MAVLKFDVTGSDPARANQNFEPPKPGVYRAKVAEINSGFSKTDGKPDRTKPRLEVIYHIQHPDYMNAPLWDYIAFTEASQWKLDQFLQATGVATAKKRKGSFDTDRLIGKFVNVRVRAGKNLQDEYKADVGGVWAATEEDEDFEDEDAEEEEDLEEDEDEDEEDEEAEEEEDEPEDVYAGMSVAQLRTAAKDKGLETKGTASAIKTRLIEFDEAQAEEDEEDEEDEEAEDDGYDALSLKDLRAELDERGLEHAEVKGKANLIALLRENDEEPF